MERENIETLEERRKSLDKNFLAKIECKMYDVDLTDYINFNSQYNTRGGTTNPHFRYNGFKDSFYCRMRKHAKLDHYAN